MPQLMEAMDRLDAVDMSALIEYGSSAITYRSGAERVYARQDQEDERKTRYWRDLQLSPTFKRANQSLIQMEGLLQNWDSYGAEPPNLDARDSARRVISVLEALALPPTKVVASSEGGVAICFVKGDYYADIECLNSGETLAVMYQGSSEPHAWEIPAHDQALTGAIERIRAHFAA